MWSRVDAASGGKLLCALGCSAPINLLKILARTRIQPLCVGCSYNGASHSYLKLRLRLFVAAVHYLLCENREARTLHTSLLAKNWVSCLLAHFSNILIPYLLSSEFPQSALRGRFSNEHTSNCHHRCHSTHLGDLSHALCGDVLLTTFL